MLAHEMAEVHALIKSGAFNEARLLIRRFKNQQHDGQVDAKERLQLELLDIEIKMMQGHHLEALTRIAQFLELLDKTKTSDPLFKLDALLLLAEGHLKRGQLERGRAAIDQAFMLIQSLPLEDREILKRKARATRLLGLLFWNRGDGDQCIKLHNKSFDLAESADSIEDMALAMNYIGLYHYHEGNMTTAMRYYNSALQLFQKIEHEYLVNVIKTNLTSVFKDESKLQEALHLTDEALEFFEKSKNPLFIAQLRNNRAELLFLTGHIDAALVESRKALKMLKTVGSDTDQARCLNVIGLVHHQKGEHQDAALAFEKALKKIKSTRNFILQSRVLFNLVILSIEQHDLDAARKFLTELETLTRTTSLHSIQVRADVARAMVMAVSKRPKDRMVAAKILEDIIANHHLDVLLKARVLLTSCDLLLCELRFADQEAKLEIERDIERRLADFDQLSKDFGSLWFHTEYYLLQARYLLMKKYFGEARRYLHLALVMADNLGMSNLAALIAQEHDKLLRTIPQDPSISKETLSINISDLEKSIASVMHQKISSQTSVSLIDDPAFLLILSSGGLPIYSKIFLNNQEIQKTELLGGLISAIQAIGQSIFATPDHVEKITFKQYTIVIKQKNQLLFCYGFKKNSYYAAKRLAKFVSLITNNRALWTTLTRHEKNPRPLDRRTTQILEEYARFFANRQFLSD